MKIYKDAELKNEVESIDLGTVPVGEKKQFTFYVLNETVAEVDRIKFTTPHKEVAVISAPSHLKPQETDKIILEWAPSITIKQGLKTLLKVEAAEIWS